MNRKWGSQNLSEGDISIESDGRTVLRLKRENEEVLISDRESSENPEYSRFVVGKDAKIILEPAMPDLPIVIKPQSPLSVLPGLTFHGIVAVPLVFSVKNGKGKKTQLLKEASVIKLSRSWFGDPWGGEVAYYLESPLHTAIDNYDIYDPYVFCPLNIVNRSNQNLTLERVLLRVPYLTIYQGEKRLYSNATRISFRGQDQISQVSFHKGPPDLEAHLKQVAQPRKTDESGLLSRSFYFIKTISNG